MKRNFIKTSLQKTKSYKPLALFVFIGTLSFILFPSTVLSSETYTDSHVVNLSSHRIGIPGDQLKSSYFSGYGMSYDYRFATQSIGWVDYYSKLTIGGFQQSYYQNAIYAGGSVGIGHHNAMGIELFLSLGAGYQRSFDDAAVYELNSDGNFAQVRDYGHGSLIIPLAFELGYQFSKNAMINGLYIQYRLDIQTPFAPANNIPIIGHEYITLGILF